MELHEFWAKSDPRMSITTHGKIAGIAAQILSDQMVADGTVQLLCSFMKIDREQLRKLIGYLASLHDIGKLDYNFQARLPEMKKKLDDTKKDNGRLCPEETYVDSYRHEKTTNQILRKLWKNQNGWKNGRIYADILGAHHQGKKGESSRDYDLFQEYHIQYEQQMRQYFLKEETAILPKIEKNDKGAVESILLGIIVLADWISSCDYFEKEDDRSNDFDESIAEKVRTFLDISGLSKKEKQWGDTFCDVWQEFSPEQLRPLQQEVEKLFQQTDEKISLVLLEAPMGEGKTEAGCYAAAQMAKQYYKNGIYFALPTAATSNQMVERMRKWLKDDVRLLHGMAWMEENEEKDEIKSINIEDKESHEKENETAKSWLAPTKRGLLSSYAVGTIDQAMMAAMQIKYGCLRMLGLSNKVLLIDELHAYDTYMGTILKCLLEWCKALEIPIVLLSATLPPKKKADMLSSYTTETMDSTYPAVTAVTKSGKVLVRPIAETTRRQTVEVKLLPILHQYECIAQKAIELTENGGCLCVMLNTVKQAQETYKAIQNGIFDGELMLFHARFPAERRSEIEARCLKLFGKDKSNRPQKAILVATQVVEQSLDVDFDIFMTSVAPVDLLLQRSGRLFRHEETPRPKEIDHPIFYVTTPEDGVDAEDSAFAEDGYVYPTCLLRQSIYLLQNKNSIAIPEDMQQLVADGYDEEKAPSNYLEAWWEEEFKNQAEAGQSEGYCICRPQEGFSAVEKLDDFLFDDEERNRYCSAKTRLGEPTVRIALVDTELYQSVKQRLDAKTYIPKKLAREVLKQSVSVAERQVKPIFDSEQVLRGTGILYGVAILPVENDSFTYDECCIEFNCELGVLIK